MMSKEINKEIKDPGVLTREAILGKTHYGVQIYAHVLRRYYKDEVVLVLRGKNCLPANNPFNRNKLTLLVSIVDGEARHRDEELEACKSDAFDFAALHYKVEGAYLLERLNKEMSLGIGEEKWYCSSAKGVERDVQVASGTRNDQAKRGVDKVNEGQGVSEVEVEQVGRGNESDFRQHCQLRQKGKSGEVDQPQFSFFKKPVRNTLPSGVVGLVEVYKKIKGTAYKKQTNALRAIQDEKEARAYKAEQFDYVTFSGTFTKRENGGLEQHSGLFVVDFDHLEDVEGLKKRLLQDSCFETVLLFVSPSGRGLKWVVSIDITKATHQQFAVGISNYLLHTYGQKMDASGKDVARACFLPWDSNVYINQKYL